MSTFTTNPVSLHTLLQRCEQGDIKLPDFQRNWVWDEYRIRSLIASISQSFPVGALMTLKSSGKTFTPRPIQGAPASAEATTESELLLDGQQRMTSLYQDKIAPTDFLQGIALLHSKAQRDAASGDDRRPPVSATRNALLALPVEAYQVHADRLQLGFERAAKFLFTQRIYRSFDLPYQSQIVPLAAILASLGESWDHEQIKQRVRTWYWCGVFGELYGSAVESRFAKDLVEVLAWIDGGAEPSTLKDTSVRASRIRELRSRQSAAYKGVNALLMKSGATDFRSGQDYDHAVFFDESVDIHHIFPRDWCQQQKLPATTFDSIVNKTPLSAKTNRMLGGVAPSRYLHRLESADPPVDSANLDGYLRSHAIDPTRLRADDFDGFFAARLDGLIDLIDTATQRPALRDVAPTASAALGSDPTSPPDPDDEADATSENAALADDAALLSKVQ